MKMNTNIYTMLMIALTLTACKNDEDKVDNLHREIDTETNYVTPIVESTAVVVTREDAEKKAEEVRQNVTVDQSNREVSIKNFTAYSDLQNQIRNLSLNSDTKEVMANKAANEAFTYFVEQMPDYLRTKLVMKEVADVRNAMNSLNADLENVSTPERVIQRHIADVQQELKELNEEIAYVRLILEPDATIDYDDYRDFITNVNYNEEGVITIANFEDYNRLQKDRMALANAMKSEKENYSTSLITNFNNMVARMPAYLKVDDVMKAVADVKKEMKEYEADRKNTSISLEERLEDLERIDDALYDLNKELIKARQKYDSNAQDPLEAFRAQFINTANKTFDEQVKEADEEYDQKIEK